jgi:uncharacterized membrane protein YgdD (TMEM256/DUF423 family)
MAQSEINGKTILHQFEAADDASARRDAIMGGMARVWIAFAAASGAVSVIAGAFAAHGLDPAAEAKEIGWLHTGSQYQSLHALAMLVVVALAGVARLNGRWIAIAQWLFLVGNILFPAALYGLAFHFPRWLGAVAPLGGSAYILGWLSLAAAAFAQPRSAAGSSSAARSFKVRS